MSWFNNKKPKKWQFDDSVKVNWIASNSSPYNMEVIIKLILTKIFNIKNIQLNVYTDDKTVSKFDTKDLEMSAILDGHPQIKTYTLFLRSTIRYYDLLPIICHEMVHLKQYHEGRLELKDTTFYWNHIPYKNVSYWNRPWEQEARSKQYEIEKQVKELYYE